MLKVGLTGGYATGKSFVAKELESLGCRVIYADKLGHQVLSPTGTAFQPAVDLFGTAILQPDGTIDRKKLGSIAFADPALLQQLNTIVHPAVFRLEEEAFASFKATNPGGIAVVEAAILIETGRFKHFDKLIVTTCAVETQITRGIARDHLTREQIAARLSKQMPAAEKLRHADYVIHTDGTPEDTTEQVHKIHAELRQLSEASQA